MTELSTVSDVLRTIDGHPDKRLCPVCSEQMARVALVDIVYAFEPCDCAVAPYRHLVQTLYHKNCFLDRNNP